MADKDFDKNNMSDKIRVVAGMVEDLDDGLKAHFYKSMLSSTNLPWNEDEKSSINTQDKPVKDYEFASAEFKLINDIANTMHEIDFLLKFENLMANP